MRNIQQLEAKNLFQILPDHLLSTPIVKNIYYFLPLVLFILLFLVVTFILRKLLILRLKLNEKQIILEITPPLGALKDSYTTEQLFSLIHALGRQRSLKDKLTGKDNYFSLEIASSRLKGIRYLIVTTSDKAILIRKTLTSYLPQIQIKEVSDYLPIKPEYLTGKYLKFADFKLKNHFAYPLKKQELLLKHDPISYLTGMMTKLEKDETFSLQIIIKSITPKEVNKISKFIFRNGDLLRYLNSISLIRVITRAPNKTFQLKSTSENRIIELIQDKIKQPLFEANLRIIINSNNKASLNEKLTGITSSFASYSENNVQSLQRKRFLNIKPINSLLYFLYQKRLPFIHKSILSSSEISSIYHFPILNTLSAENLVKTYSKDLPVPLSIKTKEFDIAFAKNNFSGTENMIGLSKEEREKHVYIIGATGTGKTTLLLSMIKEDIEKGKGLCVIDPHGDLAETALSFIPEKRKEDLIYFNPEDIKFPIGLNLLELSQTQDEDELLREKELITESVISLFRKIFSEVWSAHAHRLEYILRNTIQTALCLENPNIFTVYKLLMDYNFRTTSLLKVKDENLQSFWKNEFNKAGDYQKVKMIGPITARIGRFLFSPTAKRIMEQNKSTINFDEIMDQGKILICNLSKGKIGEDNSEVLGIMILTKLQLASLKRARNEESKRTPFYLYVDEFQNFATPSFIQMLSEARKYKLFLTMAEQSTSQQKDKNIVSVILANVGTIITFRSANPEDESLILPQFFPFIEKGEIANLPLFKFYIKIFALTPDEPFSGITIRNNINKDLDKIQILINTSRKNWATIYQKNNNESVTKTVKKKVPEDKKRK